MNQLSLPRSLVSVGPYGEENLQAIEKQSRSGIFYPHSFQKGEPTASRCLSKGHDAHRVTRESYSEAVSLNAITMLDSCFILELLRMTSILSILKKL